MMLVIVVGVVGLVGVVFWGMQLRHFETVLLSNRAAYAAERAEAQSALLSAIERNHLLLIAQTPAPSSQPLVLVVDDNESMLAYTTTMLTKTGYRVRAVTSAEAALVELVATPLPDLIVVDIRLGGMTGLDFTRQIRWAGCRMPILAYSAFDEPDAKHEAIEAGCNDFVVKSPEGDRLRHTVEQWLAIAVSVASHR